MPTLALLSAPTLLLPCACAPQAMSSHFSYWADPDVATLLLRAVHGVDVLGAAPAGAAGAAGAAAGAVQLPQQPTSPSFGLSA